jgi:hypothetical protein
MDSLLCPENNENPFGHMIPFDQMESLVQPKHYYYVTFCYTNGSPIALSPNQTEPHRWSAAGNESLGVIPNQLDVECMIVLFDHESKVIASHRHAVPVTRDWVVETMQPETDLNNPVSSIVWIGGRLGSITIKMEYHLRFFRK